MAITAGWRPATLAGARQETASARTLVLDVPGWPGHLAGQSVSLRLTAPDGYTAQRSYSLASGADDGDGERIELTVQRLADGEVSPYLTDIMEPGDMAEVRGPIGGWFVWAPSRAGTPVAPVQLIAGGSGIVPLMSMIRTAQSVGAQSVGAQSAEQSGGAAIRLLYSVRTPADVIYAAELERRSGPSLDVSYLYTRAGGGRISADVVGAATWGPRARPEIFVCGPSGFVETAADLLIAAGHDPATIKTERFGPTGT